MRTEGGKSVPTVVRQVVFSLVLEEVVEGVLKVVKVNRFTPSSVVKSNSLEKQSTDYGLRTSKESRKKR